MFKNKRIDIDPDVDRLNHQTLGNSHKSEEINHVLGECMAMRVLSFIRASDGMSAAELRSEAGALGFRDSSSVYMSCSDEYLVLFCGCILMCLPLF